MVADSVAPPPFTIDVSVGLFRVRGEPRITIRIQNVSGMLSGNGELHLSSARRLAADLIAICDAADSYEAA